MKIVKTNGGLQNRLPMLFGNFLDNDIFDWVLPKFSEADRSIPAVNIKETSTQYEVQMAAPGMAKEDFKITLEGSSITISSEKTSKNEQDENSKYPVREFSYQSFSRTFSLPKEVVDTEQIKAKYEDGVLHLTIPKHEQSKQEQAKVIEVF